MSTRQEKVIFTLLIWGVFSHASSQIEKISLTDLVLKADIIVKVKVENTISKWIIDERGKHIYTIATLLTDITMKGQLPHNKFTIDVVGGTVGDITEYVTHSYSFKKGEDVVLFLNSNPIRVVGGLQGKFTIYDGKVYLENKEVGIDRFVHAIQTFAHDPTGTLFLNNQPQLKVDPESFKQGKETVKIQEQHKLKVDEGSLKKADQHAVQNQLQLKIVPESLTDVKETVKPQGQLKLKVDEESLKKADQNVVQNQLQLKVEPESLKEVKETVKPQEQLKLKVDEGSLKKADQNAVQNQHQFKVKPESLKEEKETVKPQEQLKLKVDEGSLKKADQDNSQNLPQLEIRPISLKEEGGVR
jgi:hypothetical protein